MAAVKRYDPETKQPVLWRGWLLYLLSFPLLPAALFALQDGYQVIALARGAGFALAVGAATLIRKGIRLDNEAIRRKLRRRASTVRYRAVGAVMLAVGTALVSGLGLHSSYGPVGSVLMGLAVLLGCYLYYDFDGIGRKDPEVAAVGITTEELVELLDEAEGRIVAIENASRDIRNIEFRDRLRRITAEARDILETIERDPVDARRARKFLKVYLDGARQVTEGYARSHRHGPLSAEGLELEGNFRRVLGTIETVIAEQQEKLRENNLSELDVQIEVLQMQLEKEGVT